jgi:hypothetical protein
MPRFVWAMLVIIGVGCATAQVSASGSQPTTDVTDSTLPRGKVSLVRGVLRQLDPIHDQLLIRAFGGRDIRINFDPRTQLVAQDMHVRLTSIPTGSVLSVDTVINNGKLFAVSVRMSPSNTAEIDGQIVSYDTAKSQLMLRDPLSPENLSLHLTASTTVFDQGHSAALRALSPGTLVRVSFIPAGKTVNKIEILAARGNSFTFAGLVVAVDLHSRVLSLSNDTDQSIRELAIGSLDASSLSLLKEGAAVTVQAEFDGDRYNVRAVTPLSRNP